MNPTTDLLYDDQNRARCWWCGDDQEYRRYHDQEWGTPVKDDHRLFEKICLEGFQCGLSWLTILRRRTAFRKAFADFDCETVGRFSAADVNRLTKDESIIRHRGKINATIHNAGKAIEMRSSEGSLAAFFWQFEPSRSRPPRRRQDIAAVTGESTQMSRELKRRGWKFVGPTTCYAFMQSMGIVNDHLVGCGDRERIERLRDRFQRP
ncbi:DNA-3-methyladenine glycosylase I [Rhodopirellula sallentina]|uniref:DNA-3-methyladenine glycosylase I n=1 Tax=Rhodopirellula sallentina SM41 TaxID=1263870 RepID=M5U3K8_9BACT|nr:DNA-3-methyladenine glycosylase I [Rhodopirellula sallentina]EMI56040.1 DNA-3-methyladenine glycosylase I [Rhodopirellula sallentina SM41]